MIDLYNFGGQRILLRDKSGGHVEFDVDKLVAFNGFATVVEALSGRCLGGRPWEDPAHAAEEAETLRELLEDSGLTQELVDQHAGFIYRAAA